MTTSRPEASINGVAAIEAALTTVDRVVGGDPRRVVGWATVDTERAAAELADHASMARDVPDDALLGARCRMLPAGADRLETLLLEPATEGRIAASLARFGEGHVALYVVLPAGRIDEVAANLVRAGLVLSAEAAGPFGRERLVAGSPPWGAHLLIAEDAQIPLGSQAATIER